MALKCSWKKSTETKNLEEYMKKQKNIKVFTQGELDEIIKKRVKREANKNSRVEAENRVLKDQVFKLEQELEKYKFINLSKDIFSYKNLTKELYLCPFRVKR
jgi:hypothetical protein